MRVRLLPSGDIDLMTHELARMQHPAPTAIGQHHTQPFVCKLLDLPHDVAMPLVNWLQRHPQQGWSHQTPGPSRDSVDLIIGGPRALLTTWRHEAAWWAGFHPIVSAVERALQHDQASPTHLHLGNQVLDLAQRTLVMGILNVTPDSFSDGGLYVEPDQAIKHAEEMLTQGADIIDVGGASARPGATPVPKAVEQERVIPVVREIVQRFGATVSVDTYHASVAEAAINAGATLINDITALSFDAAMAPLLARQQTAVILMHMQGTPQTMQQSPAYHDVIDDIYSFLEDRIQYAMQHGIARQRIVCDPGFGFGKTLQHNVDLLHGLHSFQTLGQPLMVGTSRKSFLGLLLERDVCDRLEGTIASALYARLRGAAIVRVHDVGPVVQAVRLIDAVTQATSTSLTDSSPPL